jgi:hypothetical protein
MEKTQVLIPIKQLVYAECPVCKCKDFTPITRLRQLPIIYSPTGQAGLITEIVYRCLNCLSLYTKDELINQKTE